MPVKKIEIDFAGLFDTVASHGLFRLLFSLSNTKNLKLHAVSKAKQAIHLIAAEEHRENFSLTDIASAGSKGRELFLPGVHSDIGGGYRDEASEAMVIYKALLAENVALRARPLDRHRLVQGR